MKIWKIVAGIISILLVGFVLLEAVIAGVIDIVREDGGTAGAAGIFIGLFMLIGGIVSIATCISKKNGGNITLIILFGLAALLGYTNYGVYKNLLVWSTWCLINAVMAVISMVINSWRK